MTEVSLPDPNRATSLPESVLFCDDHNAVRAPMAEGIMKKLYGTGTYVQSVGVKNDMEIDGFSIAVCDELDVELSRHRSRSFDEMENWGDDVSSFDLVIALSPASQRRALELTRFYHLEVEYWPILDPTGLGETREQKLNSYRTARNQIVSRLQDRFGPPIDDFQVGAQASAQMQNRDQVKLLEEINSRLNALEDFIQPVVSAQSMIGHNNPPEDEKIEEPFTRTDWLDIQQSVDEIKEALRSTPISESDLDTPTEVLETKYSKLVAWIATRTTKALDATLVAVGTAFGASIIIDASRLQQLTKSLISSIQTFMTSVPLP